MDFLINLLPHVVNGLSLGLLFALIALGFMLIVGVMEVINLAHGSLFALGAYVALQMLGPSPTPSPLAWGVVLVAAPLVVAASGTLLELCMRRTYGRDPLYGLLLTFGAALVIEELIRLTGGSTELQLALPALISGAFVFDGRIYSSYRVFASVFARAAIVALRAPPGKT